MKRFSMPWRNFFGELRRHIMVHNFYSLCNVCLYSWTCPRLLFWNYSSRFLFLVYGCVSLGLSRSRSMTLGLSNQRNDWCSLMYHCLVDLGSLILIQIIPQEHTNYLKESWSTTPLFLFTCKSWAIVFYLEHVETTELSAKLLNIIITLSEHNLY